MTAKRLLPLTGIIAVGLVISSFIVGGETPDVDAPVKEVVSFYTDNDSDIEIASLLLGLGALFFLVFATMVRTALRSAEGDPAARTGFATVGAVLFAVGLLNFAGLGFALGDAPDKIEPAAVQALHVLNMDLWPVMAAGVFAFLVGSGLAVIKTGVFPKWLGWVTVVAGACVVTPLWFVPFIGLGLFILITSVLLAMRAEA